MIIVNLYDVRCHNTDLLPDDDESLDKKMKELIVLTAYANYLKYVADLNVLNSN